MRALLKTFLLGSLAVGLLAYAVAAVIAVAEQVSGGVLDVSPGPFTVVAVTRVGTTTVTTFGPGLLVPALVGGILNVVAAELLRRRSRVTADRVD